ncbi:MAG: hypothetical protein ACREA9_26635 [Pyrinomonadaceae bacterium]
MGTSRPVASLNAGSALRLTLCHVVGMGGVAAKPAGVMVSESAQSRTGNLGGARLPGA